MKLAISRYLLFDEPSAYSEINRSQAPVHSTTSVTVTATSAEFEPASSAALTVMLYTLSASASAGASKSGFAAKAMTPEEAPIVIAEASAPLSEKVTSPEESDTVAVATVVVFSSTVYVLFTKSCGPSLTLVTLIDKSLASFAEPSLTTTVTS